MTKNDRFPRLSNTFLEAVKFAFDAHSQQTRKGTDNPYIGHPLHAAAIVLDAGGVEDLAIAALLHDVVEDQGGEPMLHPQFFAMVELVCARGAQLKIETNGHYLSVENCARMKALGVKAVQVSLDGASAATFNRMRVRGNFDTTVEGLENLRAAGVPVEINFSPARFNVHEIGAIVDLAYELGAYSFYTGRTMYTGNAVKAWRHLEVPDSQYNAFFDVLRTKTEEYRGRMRVHFHEAGLLEELRYRLQHPAALLIVLPNGLVKLINALPFICGDFRRQTLLEIWANFRRAWHDPRVAQFVEDLAADPGSTRTLHQWVYL